MRGKRENGFFVFEEETTRTRPHVELSRKKKLINTWLILPVVICLSQRLSHACLSTRLNTVKPRIAHYNSHCLLEYRYPTWITVAILELIHAKKLRPQGTSAFIRIKTDRVSARHLVNLNNFANRTVLVLAMYLSSVCLINFRW
jgi:hypothetical protein